jgi:hypothetical protein
MHRQEAAGDDRDNAAADPDPARAAKVAGRCGHARNDVHEHQEPQRTDSQSTWLVMCPDKARLRRLLPRLQTKL